jgi:hypothetical protein
LKTAQRKKVSVVKKFTTISQALFALCKQQQAVQKQAVREAKSGGTAGVYYIR